MAVHYGRRNGRMLACLRSLMGSPVVLHLSVWITAVLTLGLILHAKVAVCGHESRYEGYVTERTPESVSCMGWITPTSGLPLQIVTIQVPVKDLGLAQGEDRCPVNRVVYVGERWEIDLEHRCTNKAKVVFAFLVYLDIMLISLVTTLV